MPLAPGTYGRPPRSEDQSKGTGGRAHDLRCTGPSRGRTRQLGWLGLRRSSLIREPHAHLLELHGLSRAGSAELLRELLGRSIRDMWCPRRTPSVPAIRSICVRLRVRLIEWGVRRRAAATVAGVVEQRLEQLTSRTGELRRSLPVFLSGCGGPGAVHARAGSCGPGVWAVGAGAGAVAWQGGAGDRAALRRCADPSSRRPCPARCCRGGGR